MAFATILRRTVTLVARHAIRATWRQRNQQGLLPYALNRTVLSRELGPRTVFASPSFSSYSTKANSDENLLRVIESEIKSAEESDDYDRDEEVPDGFPFELVDNPGEQTITLKRKYNDETITVDVQMPTTGEEGEDEDGDNDDDDTERGSLTSIPLVVNISKKNGVCLEFGCTAFPDEVAIDSLLIKEPNRSEDQIAYQGPEFSDLDENLQKAFHKYLEIRGIKPSTTNFLHEYMISKDAKEYLMWLKNLKSFFEK